MIVILFFFAHRLLLSFLGLAVLLRIRFIIAILVFWRGFRSCVRFGLLECLSRDHLDLKAVVPSLLCELHADFMRILLGLLVFLKALDSLFDFVVDVGVEVVQLLG